MKAISVCSSFLTKLSFWTNKISKMLVVSFMVLMVVVLLLQVFRRYILNSALLWPEEFAGYCMVYVAFIGGGIALAEAKHIGVVFFIKFLPNKLHKWVQLLTDAVIVLFLLYFFVSGYLVTVMSSHEYSPSMHISLMLPNLAVPLGAVIMLINSCDMLFKHLVIVGRD